ncbi:PDDEXK family nuclease [Bifidobacterium pseudocatenulatum]|uniref:VRR-NUC domain-containing protein n=1 Tax=Bifidobacterium pseudocatenulatum TaxID=28026 RepID=UPI001D02444F|nr:VRR-NUC domain-containing protein [Bifidobacterium pseudocatenulatum]UDG85757.1 VRR-NUC domain-containing protein [Bifidobacterium pseudocatenulatum]
MSTPEGRVEARLCDLVRKRGGLCLKWACPGVRGAPDRIVFLPGGHVLFVEVKRPGGRPRADQLAFHRRMARRGTPVYVVDDADLFDQTMLAGLTAPDPVPSEESA